jgi:hypothetical protein
MSDGTRGRRLRDDQGGIPIEVDLSCLTPEQRRLWDESFPKLAQWTDGSICQATVLELWSFGYMCMLDTDSPRWPSEVAEQLWEYSRMLNEYRENMRRARGR